MIRPVQAASEVSRTVSFAPPFASVCKALAVTLLAGTMLCSAPLTFAQATAEAPAATKPAPAQAAPAQAKDKLNVGLLEIEGSLSDRSSAPSFGGSRSEPIMRDVLDAIESIATDSSTDALVIRLKDASLTGAQIDELGQAIKKVRAAGKKVHLYAELFDTREFMLGAHCDEVIIQSGGAASLPGLYMEEMFLADTMRWIGVTPDFVQVGDYKGASEMYANSKPSPQWEENINQLLDSMYSHVRETIKSGRKLSDAQLDKAMESSWMAYADDVKKAGLVDSIVDLPKLTDHLKAQYGATTVTWDDDLLPDFTAEMEKKMANPFAAFRMLMEKPTYGPKKDAIAIVHVDGAIIDGESSEGGLLGGSSSVGSRTIRRALEDIRSEDKVKGVVIRINSPGGSAIASEMIWQGVKRLSEKKPVWISVGDMAASGGYYIAVSGSKIYVNPSSIVGSIGVVGGKMALGGVYEKAKINVVPRTRGPRANMMGGTVNPWSEDERKLVRQKMTETYELFTKRVSQGRANIDLAKTAEGRLFTGFKALDLKMADKIGGLEDAVTDLAAQVGLEGSKFEVIDYPAPKSLAEVIEKFLGGGGPFGARAAANAHLQFAPGGFMQDAIVVATALVGKENISQLKSSMNAMLQLRKEPVILVSPRVLILK